MQTEELSTVANYTSNALWNLSTISFQLSYDIIQQIHSMYLPHTSLRFDKFVWALTNDGKFSVKSVTILSIPLYPHIFSHGYGNSGFCKNYYTLFGYRLPKNNYLACISIINSNICPIFHPAPETSQHIFFQCPKANQLWSRLNTSRIIPNSWLNTTINHTGYTFSYTCHLVRALKISYQKLSSPFAYGKFG